MPLEMNPEIRARWTAALRSGDYQQGTNALRDGNAFCCLGVLCDLAEDDGITQASYDDDLEGYSYDGLPDLLPQSVCEWAGLGESSPEVIIEDWAGLGDPAPVELSSLNDDEGWNFASIADAIDGTVQS